jgi:adenosine deaminase
MIRSSEPPDPADPPAGPLGGSALRRLVEAMPKSELHLHLDGSIRIDTALALARSRDVDAPRTYGAMFDALVAPPRGASQADLLTRFELPISLLQDAEALELVTAELVETKAAEGVRYLEIRWGPSLHRRNGLTLAEGIAGVCQGAREAAARTGCTVRLICTAIRSHEPAAVAELAHAAVRFQDVGLSGWDLAGPEAAHPDPQAFARAFEIARDGGLRITLHAGEWGGPGQVRRALALSPERIAHGPGSVDDSELMAELIRRRVTLDLCPTSNVQAGIVASVAEHPLGRLHRAGVPVSLSTDDATVSDTLLSDEYVRAVEEIGLSLSELWAINVHGLDAAFAPPEVVAGLKASFEAWRTTIPELTT